MASLRSKGSTSHTAGGLPPPASGIEQSARPGLPLRLAPFVLGAELVRGYRLDGIAVGAPRHPTLERHPTVAIQCPARARR
jgi:hypothetical protein